MAGPDVTGAGLGPAPDPVSTARQWLVQRAGVEVPAINGPRTAAPTAEPDSPAGHPGGGVPSAPGDDELDADPEEVARRIVLRKLAAQARTRTELARALRAKAVPEEAASAVLDRMDEVGLIDDAAFASDWVSSRQQRRHLSRSALRRELQGKGVPRDEIEQALEPVGADEEHEAALSLVRRRQTAMAQLPRDVQYRRLAGVLGRRGFGGSVTAQVLAEVLSDDGGTAPHDEAPDL